MSLGGRAPVLIWLLGLAAAIGVILLTPFTTDMSAFLPRSPEPAQRVLIEQLRNGVASRLILIGLEGGTPEGRAKISRAMASELRSRDAFMLVDNGEGGIGVMDRDYVWRNRYFLSPFVKQERFSQEGLRHAFQDDLNLLSSGLEPLLKDSITRDPTGETMKIVGMLASEGERHLRDGIWISANATRALILAQTRAPGFDIDAQEQALAEVRQVFVQAKQAIRPSVGVRMLVSGPGIFGVKTRAEMKHDITLYSTIAVATIVSLLLLAYRSVTVLLLTLLPVATGALAGLAAVGLWFGFVHGITIGFGTTLIGEAVDYSIYLLAQTSRQGGAQATLQRIWPTLRLGVLVSICGFAAMLFSSFTGFVQLGIFTIVGLAVAATVTRFVLPRLLPAGFAGTRDVRFAPQLLKVVQRVSRVWPILLSLLVIASAAIALRGNDLWEDDLSSMSPVSTADQQLDRNLRRDMGAPDVRQLIVATAPDEETLLESCEQLDAVLQPLVTTGALSSYDSPDRYLPSRKMQELRRAALPDRARLKQNLAGALNGLPFQSDAFAPFLDAVDIARRAPALTRHSLDGTGLSLKLDSQFIHDVDHWVAVMPLHNVSNPQRITEALAGMGRDRVTVELLDLKTASDRLLHDYRREALLLAFLASVVIALLLVLYFKSLRQGLSVLAPLAFAVFATVALLTLRHHRLSIFNLFGLLLVVAVGSNYCLFLRRGGLVGEEGTRTVTSLLLANICTVIGFGVLSLSHIPVLYGIGSTVAIGTALSLVAGAILTPGLARSRASGGQ
jgi:predicted exporter